MKICNQNEKIGFDLGNTIYAREEEIMFPYFDAFRVIKRLTTERFGRESYIVSKVTPEQKIRAIIHLNRTKFYAKTGISPQRVEFCTERSDKAPIAKRLSLTHFVDDRPEVMVYMDFVPHRILFRPSLEDMEQYKGQLDGVVVAQSWKEIERLLL